jgi:hypothetical protein
MQVACSVLGGIVAEQSELRCSSHTDLIAPWDAAPIEIFGDD